MNFKDNYFSLSLRSVLANLFKISSLFRFRTFDKSLSIAIIDNFVKLLGSMVDLMYLLIQRIAENVLSQDAELVGIESAKCSILYKLGKIDLSTIPKS